MPQSVSGNGLHIYGKADLSKLPIAPDKNGKPRLDKQFYMKNPNNGIELYIGGLTNRFAVFTGNAVADLPLKDCTTAVLKTFKKVTGGDSLFAEFKGQQGFQYTYSGLLWFCMNRHSSFLPKKTQILRC